MSEEHASLALGEQEDDPFDLDIRVYTFHREEEQEALASTHPNGSSGVGCGHCIGSMIMPAE